MKQHLTKPNSCLLKIPDEKTVTKKRCVLFLGWLSSELGGEEGLVVVVDTVVGAINVSACLYSTEREGERGEGGGGEAGRVWS